MNPSLMNTKKKSNLEFNFVDSFFHIPFSHSSSAVESIK
jgi:hypothetical protein